MFAIIWSSALVHAADAPSKDPLRPFCGSSFPMFEAKGSFYVSAGFIDLKDYHVTPAKFIVDTGWNDVSLSRQGCKKIDCKVLDQKTLQIQDQGKGIVLGREAFRLDYAFLDFENVTSVIVDGVLGTGALFAKPILLDLANHYVCFPKDPVSKIAKALDLSEMDANYKATGAWLNLKFNDTMITDVLIDTGSDTTTLLADPLSKLKLKAISTETRTSPMVGDYRSMVYQGPVVVKGGDTLGTLPKISTAPTPALQKLGTDFLAGRILGLDAKSGKFYLSRSITGKPR